MTLAIMAERIGVTVSAVAAYENGTRNPSFDVLIKIASIFHVTVDYLLGRTDRDLLDITDLLDEQKINIRETISMCRKFNEAMEILHRNNLQITEDPTLLTGAILEHYKRPNQTINTKD